MSASESQMHLALILVDIAAGLLYSKLYAGINTFLESQME